MATETFANAWWHLRAELAWLASALGDHVREQRERGRSPAGDVVQGQVIEEGEAEGLAAILVDAWGPSPSSSRASIERRASLDEEADLRARDGATLPLLRVKIAFALAHHEYVALLLALAVEVDPRFGRLIAYLNDHVGRPRPTLGLALAVGSDAREDELPLATETLARPVVRDGLIALEGEGPAPTLSIKVPTELVAHLARGARVERRGAVHVESVVVAALDRLIVDDDNRARLREWARATVAGSESRPLLVAGRAGAGRTAFARAAASEAGLSTVEVAIDGEGWEASLLAARRDVRLAGSAALVLRCDERSSFRAIWGALADFSAPVILTTTPSSVEAAARAALREPSVVLVPELQIEQRAALVRQLLGPDHAVAPAAIDHLSSRFLFTPGMVARALRRARADVALVSEAERELSASVLERACREVGAAAMGPLAQRLPLPFTRSDLVVSARVGAELDLAVAWVKHQGRVLDRWGFGKRVPLGRGLTALFAGPPGTGKTMGAQVLARELGVDAYRVDLSRMMSKYIGETEKNLGQLFDEAHASGALLFFDEADALFGKRSEVKDAHDRYANVEIGYLLQRMEEHDGITVLATNRMRDLDEAFLRRFHVIADFPLPSESDRLAIWSGMLPAAAERSADVDLPKLARLFELSGGEIKNAVLAAAYLAAAEDSAISMAHLKKGLLRELLKAGKVVDERSLA